MHSKLKALRGQYAQLTDIERFRLFCAAYEQENWSEVEAINRSAPTATYKMVRDPYGEMGKTLHIVAWITVSDVMRHGYHLALFLWLLAAREAQAKKWDLSSPKRAEMDRKCELLERMLIEQATGALTEWAALELFCDDIAITFEQALAHAPGTATARDVIDLARGYLPDDIQPDPDAVREEADLLHAIWYKFTGGHVWPGVDAEKIKRYARGEYN